MERAKLGSKPVKITKKVGGEVSAASVAWLEDGCILTFTYVKFPFAPVQLSSFRTQDYLCLTLMLVSVKCGLSGYQEADLASLRGLLLDLGATMTDSSSEPDVVNIVPSDYAGPTLSQCVNDHWVYESAVSGSVQPYEHYPVVPGWKAMDLDKVRGLGQGGVAKDEKRETASGNKGDLLPSH